MMTRASRLLLWALLAVLAVPVLDSTRAPAQAPKQQPVLSDKEILDKLKGTRTRGLVVPAPKAADRDLVDALVQRRTRGVTVEERKTVSELAQRRPGIDIEIPFDYNSAAIGPKAVPALVMLGKALSHPDLKGAVFLLAGHTDAKGGPDYNLKLSVRRAEAVRDFIMAEFKLAPERLVAMGFGFEQLKRAGEPLAAENRRVQVVNLAGG